MRPWPALCFACGLGTPSELVERDAEGWPVCPACGSDDMVELGDDEVEDDGAIPL